MLDRTDRILTRKFPSVGPVVTMRNRCHVLLVTIIGVTIYLQGRFVKDVVNLLRLNTVPPPHVHELRDSYTQGFA